MNIVDFNSMIPCDVCKKSKQHILLFSLSFSRTENMFDLIHIDLWGRYNRTSIAGAHYLLTIVKDHSRAT